MCANITAAVEIRKKQQLVARKLLAEYAPVSYETDVPSAPVYEGKLIVAPTIDDVVKLIGPKLCALRDNRGIITDGSVIGVECDRHHKHQYFIREIIERGGLFNCATCTSGNATTTLARVTAEKVLEIPFIYGTHGDAQLTTYTNMPTKITIVCMRNGAEIVESADGMIIPIPKTQSVDKIMKVLRKYLCDYPMLTPEQQGRLMPTAKIGTRPRAERTPKVTVPKYFEEKSRWPYCRELADINITRANISTFAAESHIYVVDDPSIFIEEM